MKKIFALLILASFLMAGTYSCNKYEEGPTITVTSKSYRLTRDWFLDKAEQDGVDVTNTLPSLDQTFDDDGNYTMWIDGTEHLGSWEFGPDKENIFIKFDGSSDQTKFRIIRLTDDDLWLDEEVGSQTMRYYWDKK